MNDNTNLKPWPKDAVMIVASIAGTENREAMEGVVHKACRDCGTTVAVDTKTIGAATRLESRRGRPLAYLCLPCHDAYDLTTVGQFIDHRKPPRA